PLAGDHQVLSSAAAPQKPLQNSANAATVNARAKPKIRNVRAGLALEAAREQQHRPTRPDGLDTDQAGSAHLGWPEAAFSRTRHPRSYGFGIDVQLGDQVSGRVRGLEVEETAEHVLWIDTSSLARGPCSPFKSLLGGWRHRQPILEDSSQG